MKEIKFRAWDKQNRILGSVIELSYTHNPDFGFVPSYVRIQNYNDVTEVIHYESPYKVQNYLVIEQFTGLHDKNGKEIYEGDIVEFPSKRGAINFMGVVVYEKFCFNIKGFYDVFYDYPSLAFSEGNNYEVIGNIHENPELLEDVDD